MLFLVKYFIRWVATSHDSTRDKFNQVVIEDKNLECAILTISRHEEETNKYCKVEFIHIEKLTNVVLWK